MKLKFTKLILLLLLAHTNGITQVSCPSIPINLDQFEYLVCDNENIGGAELSGIAYNPTTDLFYSVGDEGSLVEFGDDGLARTIGLESNGGNPCPSQNGVFNDTEGIVHVVGDQFAIIEEREARVAFVTISTAIDTIVFPDNEFVQLKINGSNPPCINESGLEGLAYNSSDSEMYTVRQSFPPLVYSFPVPANNTGNAELTEITNLEYILANDTIKSVHGIHYDNVNGHILLVATIEDGAVEIDGDNQRVLIEITTCGDYVSHLILDDQDYFNANDPNNVEGITMKNGDIVLIGEGLDNSSVSKLFCLSKNPPICPITVSGPIFDNIFCPGDITTVTWDAIGLNDNVNIELIDNNSNLAVGIISNTLNDGIESYTLPTTLSVGTYYYKVTAVGTPDCFNNSGVFNVAIPLIGDQIAIWSATELTCPMSGCTILATAEDTQTPSFLTLIGTDVDINGSNDGKSYKDVENVVHPSTGSYNFDDIKGLPATVIDMAVDTRDWKDVMLRFDYKSEESLTLDILYSTDGGITFNVLENDFPIINGENLPFKELVFDFSGIPTINQNQNVILRVSGLNDNNKDNNNDNDDFKIVNMEVFGTIEILICDAPISSFETNIDYNSATVNWDAVADASTYQVEYKESTDANWIIYDAAVTSNFATISNLQANVNYDWRVKTNCTNGISSSYRNDSFTASCGNNIILSSPCDDGDPCTVGEVWMSDCSCAGGSFTGDADNDGFCAAEDPDDNNPCIPVADDSCISCDTEDIVFASCEGFENGFVKFNQVTTDDKNWLTRSNKTPSNRTGPSSASTGSFFAYIEASGSGYPNKSSILDSECINLSTYQFPSLTFDYHMYGSAMGTLTINIIDEDGAVTQLFSESGNQGNIWLDTSINLEPYRGQEIIIQIVGTSGFSYRSDIALDNICIQDMENLCVDLGGDADNDGVCDDEDICPDFDNSLFGTTCDDNDSCTINDVWGTDCNCSGTFDDSDNDGICDFNDQCPNLDDSLLLTTCDDGDPCTSGEIWGSDCNCAGGITTDADNDGVCANLDPDDSDPCSPNPCLGCQPPAVVFFECASFELDLDVFSQVDDDDLDWTINSNGTSSGSTGPDNASDGTYYIYIESSGNAHPDKVARIISDCIDLTDVTDPFLTFDYHMLGSTMGSLEVFATGGDLGNNRISLYSRSGNSGNQWLPVAIDLTPYINQSIQIEFEGVTGYSYRSDMAIDNVCLTTSSNCAVTTNTPICNYVEDDLGFFIQNTSDDLDWLFSSGSTSTEDTGPLAAYEGNTYLYIESSGDGIGYPNKSAELSATCIDIPASGGVLEFAYNMYGSTMGQLEVFVAPSTTSNYVSVWSRSGQQNTTEAEWLTTSIDLNAYANETISILFRGTTGMRLYSDIAIDAICISDGASSSGPSCNNIITDFGVNCVYNESFENSLGQWTIPIESEIGWIPRTGPTPSGGTGPTTAYIGDYYIYVEASGNLGKEAIIESPCVTLDPLTYEALYVSFNYHMYGSSMGSLFLEVTVDDLTWDTLWSVSSNQGDSWKIGIAGIESYLGETVKFRFRGITGPGFRSDFAIDNFYISCILNLTDNNNDVKVREQSGLNNSLQKASIFPNPATQFINIETELDESQNVVIELISIAGQKVLRQTMKRDQGFMNTQLDVSDISRGVYYIILSSDTELRTQKISIIN